MSVSVQSMSRPGEPLDLYYYDGETSKKQAFATTQNTKYVQSFANLTGGSSVFTIPPTNGLQDVVVSMSFAAPGTNANLALPRGWGYGLIKQVSYRYGGSSQYFLTGDQILQNALRKQTSRTSCDDLLTLGGNYASGADLASGQSAAVVLTLPHNIPSGVGKAHPLPSDLLTQQVQITVELFPVGQVWTNTTSGPVVPLPSQCVSLASAQFQVQQVMFNNQNDALARRLDMSVNAYAFPCEFVQQKQQIQLLNSAASQSVVLTGFRSGEVKSVQIWLTRASDTAGSSPSAGLGTGYNPFNWYAPSSVIMTYAGDIYARYEGGSGALWNLVNGNKSPAVDNVDLVGVPGTGITPNSVLSQWVELPFAQALCDEDSHYVLVHGKPITNGLVNLDIVTPSAQSDWVLNISYVYNTTLLFSSGTADYIF